MMMGNATKLFLGIKKVASEGICDISLPACVSRIFRHTLFIFYMSCK